METHKINGIELLMPAVPKDAKDIKCDNKTLSYLHSSNDFWNTIQLSTEPKIYTILGTCWYEVDKLVCEGFDPAILVEKIFAEYTPGFPEIIGHKDYLNPGAGFIDGESAFESWLRSEGITIDEGFKRVIIKL